MKKAGLEKHPLSPYYDKPKTTTGYSWGRPQISKDHLVTELALRLNNPADWEVFRKFKAAGKEVKLIVGEGYNHFEIPETMANPYGLLGRAVLELMGLA